MPPGKVTEMSPDEKQYLIENGCAENMPCSTAFVRMTDEEQNQVASEIMDDLEQNYEVRLEREDDGCLHAVLHEKGK